ncbi:unnamed protein product [Adineta steineri]|uniref:Uncharacterized protein n=1 Tax=Adineta steineri TaxID=433720 RepID=A0A814NVK8_9BILA|nr:unnamed protein product [Adineta steineri]CAF1204299.1 unnamed protein product [Adineta steineri]
MIAYMYIVLLIPIVTTVLVTIDNQQPRRDVNGEIIDAHDGSIQQFVPGGLYYMHAMQYGLCKEPPNYGCDGAGMPEKCGFQLDHNISIWTSPNLTSGSWTYAGNAIDVTKRPAGIVFRPHLVYNPNTKLYVLMWNYMNFGVSGQIAVAISETPIGPFVVVNTALNITRGSSGDFDLLVDTDGKGYIIYSANSMNVEELTTNYYYTTSSPRYVFPETFVEAPVLMKREGTYYALYDWCCCYCFQGSGVMVYRAQSPLGPYLQQQDGDIACKTINRTISNTRIHTSINALPTPGQGCQYHNGNTTSTLRSQQNFVIKVTNAQGLTTFVWTGDRWQQAPDGIKGHEPQYWMPLHFNSDGSIDTLDWIDEFTVDV